MAILRQFASTAGDGTGTVNGASDSSAVAVELSVLPAAAQEYKIEQLVFFVEDNTALAADKVGANALTNGIRLQVLDSDDAVVLNIDAGVPIKRLGDLMALGARQQVDSTIAAAGATKFAAFVLDFPSPIVLSGNAPARRLAVTLNDDLSNLVILKVLALGSKRGQLVA